MSESIFSTVILVLTLILMIGAVGLCGYSLFRLNVNEKTRKALAAEWESLHKENEKELTKRSDDMLQFVRMIVGQVAVLKFRTFKDTRDITKVTKSNVAELVSDVASEVKSAINQANISFDELLFTKDFYEKYIIESTVIIIKELLEKSVKEALDEEGEINV